MALQFVTYDRNVKNKKILIHVNFAPRKVGYSVVDVLNLKER